MSVIREFLAGLFGGDGYAPVCYSCRNGNHTLTPVKFSQSVSEKYEESLKLYLQNIIKLFGRMGINDITMRGPEYHTYKNNKMVPKDYKEHPRLRYIISLPMSSEFGNKVGFRYATNKNLRLTIATSFWRMNEKIKKDKQYIIEKANEIYDGHKIEYKCEYCDYIFTTRKINL